MKLQRISFIITLFFLLSRHCLATAGVLGVTAVEEEQEGKVAIVFNQKVKISGVEVRSNKENNTVKVIYPFYRAKNGRVIPQVEVLSKELEYTITRALLERKIEKEKSVDINYKIDKIDLYKKKDDHIKAFVEICFNGVLLVHARIMQSSDGVWVAWPGFKETSGRWKKQVVFLDHSWQEKIEKNIIEGYETMLSEEP